MPLPIRQHLDRLAGLNRTERAVLTQIVELAENGGQHGCYATNQTLGERLQASARTVCRTVRRLLRDRLLVQQGQTSRRTLRPSPALRACYTGPSPAACLAATQALGQRLTAATVARASPCAARATPGPTCAIPGKALPPSSAPALAIAGRPYKETRRDEQQDEYHDNQALRAELASLQKKIAALERQLAAAADPMSNAVGVAPDGPATLMARTPAAHTRGAAPTNLSAGQFGVATAPYDPAILPAQLTLPFATPTFRAAWIEFRHYFVEQHRQRLTGGRREQAALAALSQLAAHDESRALALIAQTMSNGWKGFYPLPSSPHVPATPPFRAHRPGPPAASHRLLPGTPDFTHDRA